MQIKITTIVFSVIIFLVVIELIRKERLTFKYALGWLIISLAGIFLALFENMLFGLGQVLGFELTSNFIFFMLFCIFILLSLVLTVFLCQQNSRIDSMAQHIGLLEYELHHLKEQMGEGENMGLSSEKEK